MLLLYPALAALIAVSGCATSSQVTTPSPRRQYASIPAYLAPQNAAGRQTFPPETFAWPVQGAVIASFKDSSNRAVSRGIDIRADEGTDVRASRSGRVVYCDPNMSGFGKTIIIDHGDRYQTVYCYNSELLVKAGDSVSRNDVIARVGKTGRAKMPSLHFEVRRDGLPQDPMDHLSR